MEDYINQYPVAILEDRYTGCYSGGQWIAVARFLDQEPASSGSRLDAVEAGAQGDDFEADDFWMLYGSLDWIAVGQTPDAALAALRRKHRG